MLKLEYLTLYQRSAIKNRQPVQTSGQNYNKWVKRASMAAILVAATLLLVKLYAWHKTGSASMLATLTDSLLDLFASAINFLILGFALAPADNEHRFGHGKAESIASIAQSALIVGSACLIILHCIERISTDSPVREPQLGIAAVIFTILLSSALVAFQRWVIRHTDSIAIQADSLHYQGDLGINLSVLLALCLSWVGMNSFDAIVAIAVAAYLIVGAWKIARRGIDDLLDHELPLETQQQILAIALNHPAVLGVHDLRTRRAGKTPFVQLHIELADNMSLLDAHKISIDLTQQLREVFEHADIIIHQEAQSISQQEKREKNP